MISRRTLFSGSKLSTQSLVKKSCNTLMITRDLIVGESAIDRLINDANRDALLSSGQLLSWGDYFLRLWSGDGVPLALLEGHYGIVNGARELADGRVLSWDTEGSLRLWSSEGAAAAVLEEHAPVYRSIGRCRSDVALVVDAVGEPGGSRACRLVLLF